MAEVKLKAYKREDTGKGAARRSRREGRVPAVLYGHGADPQVLEVDRREFIGALLGDAGMNVLLDLDIDGTTTLALTKELQRDPVRGTVLHADFIAIDRSEKVDVEVPVHLAGTAPGTGEGGVLEHPTATLLVRALATEVPESVEVDISGLGMGDSIKVSDLNVSGFEVLVDPDTVIASVSQPISEEELESLEADAGIVQEESADPVEGAADEAPDAEAPEDAGTGADPESQGQGAG